MKRQVIIFLAIILSLSGCGYDENSNLIKNYLHTTQYVKNDGWTVSKIEKIDDDNNAYSVIVEMGVSDQQSFDLFYNLIKLSRESYYERLDNLESKYRDIIRRMCPDIKTANGKAFWNSNNINYFLLLPHIKNYSGVIQVSCINPNHNLKYDLQMQ